MEVKQKHLFMENHLTLVIKNRVGRPSKEMVAARKAAEEALVKRMNRPKDDVLKELVARFDMLTRLTRGALNKNIRAVVVAGAPGIGKSYNVRNELENFEGAKYNFVSGALSAVNLYKLAYEHRNAGDVVVLDDADGIFNDENALNILKILCDSSPVRRVSYMKEADLLLDNEIPKQFDFHGAFIFITNQNFQQIVDEGNNKMVPHFSALMDRSVYLDLQVHNRRSLVIWVSYIAKEGKFFEKEGIPADVGDKILEFLENHQDNLRSVSIRTLTKMCGLYKTDPNTWEDDAKMLFVRSTMH